MSSAAWSSPANGSAAIWDENKTRADLERLAPLYDDPTITYDSISVYYDGFNPTTTTPEGEAGAVWLPVAE